MLSKFENMALDCIERDTRVYFEKCVKPLLHDEYYKYLKKSEEIFDELTEIVRVNCDWSDYDSPEAFLDALLDPEEGFEENPEGELYQTKYSSLLNDYINEVSMKRNIEISDDGEIIMVMKVENCYILTFVPDSSTPYILTLNPRLSSILIEMQRIAGIEVDKLDASESEDEENIDKDDENTDGKTDKEDGNNVT